MFFFVTSAFVFGVLLFFALIRPHKPSPDKRAIYECGEPTIGSSWIRYNIRFYTIALVYLIFDVELIFLFPIALKIKSLGLLAFIEMGVFVLILAVGLLYAWKQGNLDWIRDRKGTREERISNEGTSEDGKSLPVGEAR